MNYGEFKTLFTARLNRTDLTAALTTSFIGEALYELSSRLIHPMMIDSTALVVQAGGYVVVPTDYRKMIDLFPGTMATVTDDTRRLVKKSLAYFLTVSTDGEPAVYTRVGANWYIRPDPGTGETVTCIYYANLPEFTVDATDHDIFDIGREALLYTALCNAAEYFVDERMPMWEKKKEEAIALLQASSDEGENEEGAMVVSPNYEECL
jgi:hypothetical protein